MCLHGVLLTHFHAQKPVLCKFTYISGHHILSPCLLAYCSPTCSVCSWVHLYIPFTSPSLERACWCENCWSACSSVKAAPTVLPLGWTPRGNPER